MHLLGNFRRCKHTFGPLPLSILLKPKNVEFMKQILTEETDIKCANSALKKRCTLFIEEGGVDNLNTK